MQNDVVTNLENSLEKPAPSNSRLKVKTFDLPLHKSFDFSWDKMTIIGNLNKYRVDDFSRLVSVDPYFTPHKVMTDLFVGKAYGELFYIEYDKLKGDSFNRRNFRVEFNPNNCDADALVFFKTKILPYLVDVGFSRLDLACDVEFNLSDLYIDMVNPTKQSIYIGRDKKIETRYFGSRNSERYVRIYNKKQERLDNDNLKIDKDTFWRLEIELKRDSVNRWNKVFDDMLFKFPEFSSIDKYIDRLVCQQLVADPTAWNGLTKYQRSKYKKLITEAKGFNLTEKLKVELKENEQKLFDHLELWTDKKFTDLEYGIDFTDL